MSLSGEEPHSFFGPIEGKTSIFLLDGRQANVAFATALAGLLARARSPCAVLDLDALYSSGSDRIFGLGSPLVAGLTTIQLPDPGSDVESELSSVFRRREKVVIIDSLNSLYHLISMDDGSSRSRRFAFALASLSYLARTNGMVVILTMYRREGLPSAGTGRPISALSDITASVNVKGGELEIRLERGSAWPGGSLSIRIPSG